MTEFLLIMISFAGADVINPQDYNPTVQILERYETREECEGVKVRMARDFPVKKPDHIRLKFECSQID